MKVFLVNPSGTAIGLNSGLGYLVASLQMKGHSVKGLDLNNCRVDNPGLLIRQVVENYAPDIIGISVKSLTYPNSVDIAKSIKEYYAGPIVFGGIHTSIAKEEILQNNPCVDYVLVGEGEESLCQLVESINDKRTLSKIKGLIYRNGSDIVTNEPADVINDLDKLPFPDFRCFGVERIERYPIVTSRGCPCNCSFCLAPKVTGKKWRARNAENIIQEIKHASKIYKIDSIQIMDDNFTLKKDRVAEFCNRCLQEGFKFLWECSNGIRADKVDYELAELMKKAGLFSVSLGVESLHPEVFNQINKGETIEEIKNTVKILRKLGISVTGFFIIGLPGDTYERTMYSYNEAKKIGFDKVLFQLLMPFPMTKVYDWLKENGHILSGIDTTRGRLGEVTFETPDFTAEERKKAFLTISIKNLIYPYDLEKSKIKNILYLLQLALQYDIKNIHKHLYKFSIKSINIIFKGQSATLTGIHFRRDDV